MQELSRHPQKILRVRSLQNAGRKEMIKHVLVTGASGFIGRHLCRYLIAKGYQVRAIVRRPDPSLKRLGVDLWLGDLWDAKTLAEILLDVDLVFHCAGDATFGNGRHYHHANVELTRHVLTLTKEKAANLRRFIYVSTIGAIDRPAGDPCITPLHCASKPSPTSDYGRSKLESESAVRNSGLPYVIVRPTMVVGADMRYASHFAVFARHALGKTLIGRIAWPGQFSVIHVDDLVEALLTVAEATSATSNTYFCAGEPVSLSEFFEQVVPNIPRLGLTGFTRSGKALLRWLPFRIKALLLPALIANDQELRALGWAPRHTGLSALRDVIEREQRRLDPMLDPGGQTIITGAASGLGKALTEKMAPIRNHILLVDRDAVGLSALQARHPHCSLQVLDLADADQITALLESTAWNAHPITELYACAGFGARGTVLNIAPQTQIAMFGVNVLSRLTIGITTIQTMVRHQFGRVVFISSSSAFQPLPFMATYAASNSALLSLGEAWSREVCGQGVHLMTICPGGMSTNFQSSAGVKSLEGEKLMTPHAVVDEIFRALPSYNMTLIVSIRSLSMSLLARVLPRNLLVALWYRLMKKLR